MVRTWFDDGVHSGINNSMQVSADGQSGLVTRIATGEATVGGVHCVNSAIVAQTHAAAHPTSDRIDAIVAVLNKTVKPYTISLDIRTGNPQATPIAPVARDGDSYVDVVLAHVFIEHGTSTLSQSDVTQMQPYFAPRNGLPAGTVLDFYGVVIPDRYIGMTGQSITLANYPALAKAWNLNISESITLPNTIDKFSIGAVSGIGNATLTTSNLPSHAHVMTHGHSINDPSHAHVMTHGHSINDPSHAHGIDGDLGERFGVTGAGGKLDSGGDAQSFSYGNIDAVQTGITINNFTGNTGASSTGITINNFTGNTGNTGSGSSFSIVPSAIKYMKILKVH
jgi:hypothetical protein